VDINKLKRWSVRLSQRCCWGFRSSGMWHSVTRWVDFDFKKKGDIWDFRSSGMWHSVTRRVDFDFSNQDVAFIFKGQRGSV